MFITVTFIRNLINIIFLDFLIKMKNRKNIDFERLINKTVDFLFNEKIIPDLLDGSARGENNLWGKLCVQFFGSYCLRDSIYIYTAWNRNMNLYQTRVKQLFFIKNNENNTSKIKLNLDEISLVNKMILIFRDGRRCFSADFTKLLSKKLQILGTKCWLKCNFNWFRKQNSRKTGNFWNGKYQCIECNKVYSFSMNDESMEYLNIENFEHDNPHVDFVIEPNFRISGEKRKILALEIASKGISNFRAEKFLFNKSNLVFYKKSKLNMIFFKLNLLIIRKYAKFQVNLPIVIEFLMS